MTLLFLIPFYIFCFEHDLTEYKGDEHKLRELKKHFAYIRERLEALFLDGKISEFVKFTILDMSKKVIRNLAFKYANVREGVTSVMGGKILEHEAKKILRDGFREGEKAGEKAGREAGEKIGREAGEKIGREAGEKIGREAGEKIGKAKGKLDAYIGLVKDGLLSISDAALRLNITEDEFKKHL